MISVSWVRVLARKLSEIFRFATINYQFFNRDDSENPFELGANKGLDTLETCSTCGTPITFHDKNGLLLSHNADTCYLVNLALAEMGVSLDQFIRVHIYPHYGPVKGFYSPADPYTIHISEHAYSLYPQYTIFHETKHLIDCMMKGWSEEQTPDSFARSLCKKHGFRCPPPHQPSVHVNPFGLMMKEWQ